MPRTLEKRCRGCGTGASLGNVLIGRLPLPMRSIIEPPQCFGFAFRGEVANEAEAAAEASNSAFKEWRKHSGKIHSAMGVSSNFKGWTGRPDVTLNGVPRTARCMDVLDMAWAHRLSLADRLASSSDLKADFWANVAQAVQRRPWGGPGTLTTNGVWYSFQRDTVLDGLDAMRLQGLPPSGLAGLSNSQKKELAGEAFNVPCMASFVAALYLQPFAEWWQAVSSA